MIPVSKPAISQQDIMSVHNQMTTGWISSESPVIHEFERQFAYLHNCKYGVAVSNGTAALDIAVAITGVSKGDEVVIATFTIISCMSEVLRRGAVPIFVDCGSDYNVSFTDVQQKITPKTKVVIIPHIFGLGSEIKQIFNYCRGRNIVVIEDCAQAIGQEVNDATVGTYSDMSVYSFYPNKHITTGEGGMICTNTENYNVAAQSFRNLCFIKERRFVHEDIGWNYRMTGLQAALGLSQLANISTVVNKKRELANIYNREFLDSPIQCPEHQNKNSLNWYWVYPVVFPDTKIKTNITSVLDQHKIGWRPFFYPLNLQPVLKNYDFSINNDCPNSLSVYERGIYIPLYADLLTSDIIRIAHLIKSNAR